MPISLGPRSPDRHLAPDRPFEGCQRGKRTIAVDLRCPAGLVVVDDLVRRADVVMHNLRPGKAEKLGDGRFTCHGTPMELVTAKPLPSSD